MLAFKSHNSHYKKWKGYYLLWENTFRWSRKKLPSNTECFFNGPVSVPYDEIFLLRMYYSSVKILLLWFKWNNSRMYCSQENIKIINLIVAFSIAFFVRLLFNSSAYNIRSHYQIDLAFSQLLLGCLLRGIHLYTFYTEMSIRYIYREQELFQQHLSLIKPTVVSISQHMFRPTSNGSSEMDS